MHAPSGPNIVPKLPAPVGGFDFGLDAEVVAEGVFSNLITDTYHTETQDNVTLRNHYIGLIKTQIGEVISRPDHAAVRDMNSTEAGFVLRTLQLIKHKLENNPVENNLKSLNLNDAVIFLNAEYTTHLENANTQERIQLPTHAQPLQSIDRFLDVIIKYVF